MIGTRRPASRFKGSGDTLRLRVTTAPDPLANVRQCCRALGVEAQYPSGVRDQYAASRRQMQTRFWGSDEGTAR
jgi:hypothetical protein